MITTVYAGFVFIARDTRMIEKRRNSKNLRGQKKKSRRSYKLEGNDRLSTCRNQRLCQVSPSSFWTKLPLWNWNLPVCLDWLSSTPRDPPASASTVLGWQVGPAFQTQLFCVGTRDWTHLLLPSPKCVDIIPSVEGLDRSKWRKKVEWRRKS